MAWETFIKAVDGFLQGKRYLLHDRDPLFTVEFVAILGAAGVKCVKLPARSPDLNAYAERWWSYWESGIFAPRSPSMLNTITSSVITRDLATDCSRLGRRENRPAMTFRWFAASAWAAC